MKIQFNPYEDQLDLSKYLITKDLDLVEKSALSVWRRFLHFIGLGWGPTYDKASVIANLKKRVLSDVARQPPSAQEAKIAIENLEAVRRRFLCGKPGEAADAIAQAIEKLQSSQKEAALPELLQNLPHIDALIASALSLLTGPVTNETLKREKRPEAVKSIEELVTLYGRESVKQKLQNEPHPSFLVLRQQLADGSSQPDAPAASISIAGREL
jgi:hypothetical protein